MHTEGVAGMAHACPKVLVAQVLDACAQHAAIERYTYLAKVVCLMLACALDVVVLPKIINLECSPEIHPSLHESALVILPLAHIVVELELSPICPKQFVVVRVRYLLRDEIRLLLDSPILALVIQLSPQLHLDLWQLPKRLTHARAE